jgi:hypothetical protein
MRIEIMQTISIKEQKVGELILPETIEGVVNNSRR